MRNLIRVNHYPLWVSAATAVDASTSGDGGTAGGGASATGATASNDMGLVLTQPSSPPSPPSSLTSAVSLHHFDLHRRHYSILLSGKTIS